MQLGRYTLVRRVGSGGMAEVWKAKVKGPAGFEKVLAIKRILPNHLTEQDYVDLFIHEAKLVAQLQHPNIVQVFDFGVVEPNEPWERDDEYYMAMEYVAGQNVRAVTKRMGLRGAKWPVELSLFIVMEAAKALAYAHRGPDGLSGGSVIHRDISPHNILVSYRGRVKVTDFGIARVTNMLPRTADGVRRGKISYMSPEQLDLRPLDGRSDIFSLGAVLFEMLTGEKLFAGADKAEIAYKIRTFDLQQYPHLDQVPGETRYILERALHIDPEKRFQDARDMENELRSVLGTTGEQEAPVALSSLIRDLFDAEFQRETVLDDFDAVAATRVTPQVNLEEDQSNSSATLISSAAQVHLEQPEDLADKPDSRPEPVFPTPAPSGRPRRAFRTAALVGAAAALIGLGVVLAKLLPGPAGPAAEQTPQANSTHVATVTVTATVRPSAAQTATPAATARRTPQPTPARTRRPTPRPTPAVVAGTGYVSVAARPWASVYVDGKLVARETPVRRFKLSSGSHTVEARHPAMGSVSRRVHVSKGEHVRLFVDVRRKTIREQ